jgi:MYXO-CTERM domain-containing protein
MELGDAGVGRPMATSGCGCRAARGDARGGLALVALLALFAMRRRRR